jgi:hypothetical protein
MVHKSNTSFINIKIPKYQSNKKQMIYISDKILMQTHIYIYIYDFVR